MRNISAILFTFLASGIAWSQAERLVNGGLENIDLTVTPTPGYDYAIEYAPVWRSIYGTVDVCHPDAPYDLGGIPHTGDGMMRLGHLIEYGQSKTLDLVAGRTYELSFWGKIAFASPSYARNLGMMISTTDFSGGGFDPVTDFVPQLIIQPSANQWNTGSYCFTATVSGPHYVVIGGQCDPIPEDDLPYFAFNVDDLSVLELSDNSAVPVAEIGTTQTTLCLENLTLDGSPSTNETGYHWVIEQQQPDGSYTCLYTQPEQNGQAGVFDVNAAFASVGHESYYSRCYRAYLYVSNQCEVRDYIEFCVDDPRIQFLSDSSPLCENVPIELEVTGDNGWSYQWTQGGAPLASGTGLKTLIVTPTEAGTVSYSVTVTTPQGCTHTQTITFNVSSLAGQVAPTMNGIDGNINEYTVYAHAGETVSFTSTIFNNAGEAVVTSFNNINLPNGYTFNFPPVNSSGGTFSFNWQIPVNTAGDYSFTVGLLDKNGCQPLASTYTFRIIVICDYCPVCISYDDRTPDNNPLPPVTKAGQCIEVGMNAVVEIGTGNSVYFQAGESITMGDFFDTESGEYEAVIDPTTCVEGCEDCCSNFTGFTIDTPLPNVLSFTSTVGNAIWFAHDDDNPWCAFNATGFELYILNSSSVPVYKLIRYEGQGCCPFRAPDPSTPSSIFWDGRINTGISQGQAVPDGVYFYVLYLHGCGQTALYDGNISVYNSPSGMIVQDNTTGQAADQALVAPDGNQENVNTAVLSDNGLPRDYFFVFPNPTKGFVRIHAAQIIQKVQVLDMNGKLLLEKTTELDQPIDLSAFSAGTYRILTTLEDQQIKENTIIKE